MTVRIRITTAPPSNVAPDKIREAWVGLEMPTELPRPNLVSGLGWSGSENAGGYVVSGIDAVQALLEAGKTEAVQFWSAFDLSFSLRFGADYCEVVSQ